MHRVGALFNQLAPPECRQARSQAHAVSESKEGGYEFTVDSAAVLPEELRRQYEENGFFVIKRLVPESDLEKYRKRFLEISSGASKAARGTLVMRDIALAKAKKKDMGEENITKLQDFQNDETLFGYCRHPKVLEYVKGIVGQDVKTVHTMLINKPPDVGLGSSRHPPHQDLWYFPFRPANLVCASWTAMQTIDTENGCLFVKPGSHKGELLKHEYPNDGIVNKAYHGIQNMSSAAHGKTMFNLLMQPGDTVFFHPLLIHGSGRNNSQRFRKAISCHYASTECHYEDASGTVQEDIAKELEEMARMHGKDFTWQDIFRNKARLVAGKGGTL